MTSSYSWKFTASNSLIRFVVIGYFLALIACLMNALPLVIKLVLVMFVFLHGLHTLKKLAAENWQLNYQDEKGWHTIEFGITKLINILPSTVISKWFIFLHYQTIEKKIYRIITKDALLRDINDYRQLIVMLKTDGLQ